MIYNDALAQKKEVTKEEAASSLTTLSAYFECSKYCNEEMLDHLTQLKKDLELINEKNKVQSEITKFFK